MEQSTLLLPSERLINPNITYLTRFTDVLNAFSLGFDIQSIGDFLHIINDQLDQETVEIVTRRILNQSVIDIAEQMNLDWKYVKTVADEAPLRVIVPFERPMPH